VCAFKRIKIWNAKEWMKNCLRLNFLIPNEMISYFIHKDIFRLLFPFPDSIGSRNSFSIFEFSNYWSAIYWIIEMEVCNFWLCCATNSFPLNYFLNFRLRCCILFEERRSRDVRHCKENLFSENRNQVCLKFWKPWKNKFLRNIFT